MHSQEVSILRAELHTSERTETNLKRSLPGYSTRSLRHLTLQLSKGLHDHSQGWLSDPPKTSRIHTDPSRGGLLAEWKQASKGRSPQNETDEIEDRRAPRYSDGQVAAYAAARMPATYAALVHVLGEVSRQTFWNYGFEVWAFVTCPVGIVGWRHMLGAKVSNAIRAVSHAG